MARKTKADLADKVARYIRARESGKRGYERADRLIHEIAASVEPGTEIQLSETGRKAILRDRFNSNKDIIWTPCAARRWELEIVEP